MSVVIHGEKLDLVFGNCYPCLEFSHGGGGGEGEKKCDLVCFPKRKITSKPCDI